MSQESVLKVLKKYQDDWLTSTDIKRHLRSETSGIYRSLKALRHTNFIQHRLYMGHHQYKYGGDEENGI